MFIYPFGLRILSALPAACSELTRQPQDLRLWGWFGMSLRQNKTKDHSAFLARGTFSSLTSYGLKSNSDLFYVEIQLRNSHSIYLPPSCLWIG
ncbi:hypothetical protein BDP27DRAFT_268829 [Rhodocollybia butyracea]|uniref:Uncharacterized protein n=1 Tax=Rhodocollybia butyracea TaxID=206335 RepID=A0A9P5Q4C9_9AGAR|nr:hypothetical protein BDP27DRAFT_268829 [Rhodocollybia butyracea]